MNNINNIKLFVHDLGVKSESKDKLASAKAKNIIKELNQEDRKVLEKNLIGKKKPNSSEIKRLGTRLTILNSKNFETSLEHYKSISRGLKNIFWTRISSNKLLSRARKMDSLENQDMCILRVGYTVATLTKEFFASFMTLGVIGAHAAFGTESNPIHEKGNPILLIHGYGMNSGHFAYLKHSLEKRGAGPIFTIDLGTVRQSIDDYAKKVNDKVEEIQKHNQNKITLIGHSLGGVTAARYLANCENTRHIAQVITLGSPLQGTWLAYMTIGKCGKQMRPNSPYLKQLEKDLASKKVSIITVGSQCDELIIPNKSTFFKTAKTEKKVFKYMGHNNYLFSDDVAEFLFTKINS